MDWGYKILANITNLGQYFNVLQFPFVVRAICLSNLSFRLFDTVSTSLAFSRHMMEK